MLRRMAVLGRLSLRRPDGRCRKRSQRTWACGRWGIVCQPARFSPSGCSKVK